MLNNEPEIAPAIVTQTPRLTLRHFQLGDLDALAPILADREVMHFSSVGSMTRWQTQNFLEGVLASYQQRGFGLYAVIYRANQQLIGYCGFFAQEIDGQPEVEIGYRLASAYWGKGLATEAAIAVRDCGWKLGFSRLISIIDPNNIRSIRVAQKVGMHYEKDSVFQEIPVRIYSLNKN